MCWLRREHDDSYNYFLHIHLRAARVLDPFTCFLCQILPHGGCKKFSKAGSLAHGGLQDGNNTPYHPGNHGIDTQTGTECKDALHSPLAVEPIPKIPFLPLQNHESADNIDFRCLTTEA